MMRIEDEMIYAIADVHRYFKFEDLFFRTEDSTVKRHTARMMIRKAMDIFPELNTREPQAPLVYTEQDYSPRLVK